VTKKKVPAVPPKPWPIEERRGACRALSALRLEMETHPRASMTLAKLLEKIDALRHRIDPDNEVEREALDMLERQGLRIDPALRGNPGG
jgi:hypothetical protein